jgi:hypothetical protein
LINNFVPSLTQPFTQQLVSSDSVKVVHLNKNEVIKLDDFNTSQHIILNFSWSPNYPKKNALFGIVVSFDYMIDTQEKKNAQLYYNLRIYDYRVGNNIMNPETTGEWETVAFQTTQGGYWPKPNQSEYPINFGVGTIGIFETETFIRNVNLMLLVIDG